MNKTMNPFLDIFNIPADIKHDHSAEGLALINEGIKKCDRLLDFIDEHSACVEHVVKYAELNIKYLFLAKIANPETAKMCLDLFIPNILNLFLKDNK